MYRTYTYFYGVNIHEKYMMRAIQLGANGLGSTAPNPMVGAVIVYEDRIVGEGYTAPYGGDHAEVRAIRSVKNKEILAESTLYVTLEPCAHFGKTPPCTDLILKHAIPRVVIGIVDPHEKVAGKGLSRLKEAGCQVETGILESACREHHRRFLCRHEQNRPYIILKWAQSRDGFLAPDESLRSSSPAPFWISNARSKQLVHRWRSEEQAILVGSTTVIADNPRLTTRQWSGKSPLRVILDKDLSVQGDYFVFDSTAETLVITANDDPGKHIAGIRYEIIDFGSNLAANICRVLLENETGSLLVEGGAHTLQTFIDAGLWDEARIFYGDVALGNGLSAPVLKGRQIRHERIGDNSLIIIRND